MKTLVVTTCMALGLALALPAVSHACPGKDNQAQAGKNGKSKNGKATAGKNRAAPQPPKS